MMAVDPPVMIWSYQNTYSISSSGSSNSPQDIFAAIFNGDYTVLSIATIFNVTLAHHNNMMRCLSPPTEFTSVSISIAGT